MTMGTSMYGFNPYMNTGLNADFMSTATANPYTNPYADPYSQLAALQQPTADTFQKSEGGSGLNSGLKLAAVGGVGAGAGAYFFGDKLGASFVKDGKFSDELLRAVENSPASVEKIAQQRLAQAKTKILKRFNMDDKTFKALQQYAKAKDVTKLKPEVRQLVQQAGINSQAEALTKLTQINADFGKIDLKGLTAKAEKLAEAGSLKGQTAQLAKLQARENLIHTLADNAKKPDIKKLIIENAEQFGIKGDKTVIEREAERLVETFKTKQGAIKALKAEVTAQQELVKTTRSALNGKVAGYWDDAAKAFKADAPEALTKAAKNFKWAKAGKFAAIAAGAGLVLGWMFGGNKS